MPQDRKQQNQDPAPPPASTTPLLISILIISCLILILLIIILVRVSRESQGINQTIRQIPNVLDRMQSVFQNALSRVGSVAQNDILPIVRRYLSQATGK